VTPRNRLPNLVTLEHFLESSRKEAFSKVRILHAPACYVAPLAAKCPREGSRTDAPEARFNLSRKACEGPEGRAAEGILSKPEYSIEIDFRKLVNRSEPTSLKLLVKNL